MTYRLFILKRAQKELSRITGRDFDQIKESVLNLAGDPRPKGCKKLTGREGWRIRVGKYRVVYEVDDKHKSITILHIGHRKDIYRI